MNEHATNGQTPQQLGAYEFSPELKQLRHVETGETVALEDKISELLEYFLTHTNSIVSKDDILDTVWGGRNLSEQTVPVAISKLRKALGDTQPDNRLIQTVPKRGYRLVVPATDINQNAVNNSNGLPNRFMLGAMAVLAVIVVSFLWPTSTPLVPPVDANKPGIILTVKDIRTELESQKDTGKVIALSELASYYLSQIPEVLVIRHWWNIDAPDPTGGIFTRYGPDTPVYLLTGSLIEDEEQLLVTLFLSNPRTDEVIWSGVHPAKNGSRAYFNTLADMFATIGVLGTPQSRGSMPNAPSEDDRYWAARYLTHLSSGGAAKRAAEMTDELISLEPTNVAATELAHALAARWTEIPTPSASTPTGNTRQDYMTLVDQAVIAFYKAGDRNRARALIDEALQLAPGDHYAQSLKAEILAKNGDQQAAITAFKKAARLAPFASYEERIAELSPSSK